MLRLARIIVMMVIKLMETDEAQVEHSKLDGLVVEEQRHLPIVV